MSENGDREDRTEQPTEKRLREARERGDVPRSRELGNVAVLGAASIALLSTGAHIASTARTWLHDALVIDPAMVGQHDRMLAHAGRLVVDLLLPFAPVIGVTLLACLIGPAVMGSLRISGQALQPDFKRLSPLAGLSRMYGRDSLVELFKSLLRVALVGGVGAWVVRGALPQLASMSRMDLDVAIATGMHTLLGALLAMAMAMGLLAAIDVPWQRFRHRSRLKMTKQELRDELKQTEGNPEIKARVRQVARQMAQRRMMEAVPTADVVITNPTHYAVALKYEAGRQRAPRVVAKGADEIALAIRDVAGKHRVTVVEAPPLARALYRHGQIDREIPVNLYAAVAQVLSYVYQLKRWHPMHGPMPVLSEVPVDPRLSDGGADGEPTR